MTRYLILFISVHILFFALFAVALYQGALWGRRLPGFVMAWLVGAVAVTLKPSLVYFVTAYVAMLDIALVLLIAGGDVGT
jgi:hypothetical protein